MGKHPVFSVILPTYRRPQFLSEAIDSVLAQDFGDFELLVVDDASPETPFLPDDERVRLVVRETNGGPPRARNTGLAEARGQYVAFIDDDDLFTPQRLSIALKGLERAPIALCLSAPLGKERIDRGRRHEGDVRDSIVDEWAPHLGEAVVQRDIVERLDQELTGSADVEWWIRQARRGPVTTVPEVGYLIRSHPGIRLNNDKSARVMGSIRILEKHALYFRDHPRAAAFRLSRIGVMAAACGDHHLARRAQMAALKVESDPRYLARFITSMRPTQRSLPEARGRLRSVTESV